MVAVGFPAATGHQTVLSPFDLVLRVPYRVTLVKSSFAMADWSKIA